MINEIYYSAQINQTEESKWLHIEKVKSKRTNEKSVWKIVKLLPYGQKINDAIS